MLISLDLNQQGDDVRFADGTSGKIEKMGWFEVRVMCQIPLFDLCWLLACVKQLFIHPWRTSLSTLRP